MDEKLSAGRHTWARLEVISAKGEDHRAINRKGSAQDHQTFIFFKRNLLFLYVLLDSRGRFIKENPQHNLSIAFSRENTVVSFLIRFKNRNVLFKKALLLQFCTPSSRSHPLSLVAIIPIKPVYHFAISAVLISP